MESVSKKDIEKVILDLTEFKQETRSLLNYFGKNFLRNLTSFEERLIISNLFSETGKEKIFLSEQDRPIQFSKISLLILNFIESQYFIISKKFQNIFQRLENLKAKSKSLIQKSSNFLKLFKNNQIKESRLMSNFFKGATQAKMGMILLERDVIRYELAKVKSDFQINQQKILLMIDSNSNFNKKAFESDLELKVATKNSVQKLIQPFSNQEIQSQIDLRTEEIYGPKAADSKTKSLLNKISIKPTVKESASSGVCVVSQNLIPIFNNQKDSYSSHRKSQNWKKTSQIASKNQNNLIRSNISKNLKADQKLKNIRFLGKHFNSPKEINSSKNRKIRYHSQRPQKRKHFAEIKNNLRIEKRTHKRQNNFKKINLMKHNFDSENELKNSFEPKFFINKKNKEGNWVFKDRDLESTSQKNRNEKEFAPEDIKSEMESTLEQKKEEKSNFELKQSGEESLVLNDKIRQSQVFNHPIFNSTFYF